MCSDSVISGCTTVLASYVVVESCALIHRERCISPREAGENKRARSERQCIRSQTRMEQNEMEGKKSRPSTCENVREAGSLVRDKNVKRVACCGERSSVISARSFFFSFFFLYRVYLQVITKCLATRVTKGRRG